VCVLCVVVAGTLKSLFHIQFIIFGRFNVDVFVILGTPVPLVNACILLNLHRLCRVRVCEYGCLRVCIIG